MPLVFIHGVNVREDGDYDQIVAQRDSLFRRFALKQIFLGWKQSAIFNPYWGGVAAEFAWHHASLPTGDEDILGGVNEELALFLAEEGIEPSAPDTILLTTARSVGLAKALDLLFSSLAHFGQNQLAPEVAALAESAIAYANKDDRPQWLAEVNDDQAFLTELKQQISAASPTAGKEVLGFAEVWDRMREAADRMESLFPAGGSKLLLQLARSSLHKMIATFIGDVMVYLHQRDQSRINAPILQAVLPDLYKAAALRDQTKEPLIVVAHSMGGNIMCDVLAEFAPELAVDALITVGSQPPLFEELKLLATSQPGIPNPQVKLAPKPKGAKEWINIFDRNDILSFAAAKVFADVSDFKYSSGVGLFHAHTSYFIRPSFQDRLGKRLQEAWTK